MISEDPCLVADRVLLQRLKAALPELKNAKESLLREDGIYRFWHQSFKVFYLQSHTTRIFEALKAVSPQDELNPWFLQIVTEGTGKHFDNNTTNANWLAETRPILEAWWHADHMLDCAIWSAEHMQHVSGMLEYPWATILCLYNQR